MSLEDSHFKAEEILFLLPKTQPSFSVKPTSTLLLKLELCCSHCDAKSLPESSLWDCTRQSRQLTSSIFNLPVEVKL